MFDLPCVGKDGITRVFKYDYARDQFEPKWHFRVYADPPDPSGDWFDFTVEDKDPNTVRVDVMNANGVKAYQKMGIPEAIIVGAASVLGKRVVSSPSQGPAGVWRTPEATKAWERLLKQGKANYDHSTDLFAHPVVMPLPPLHQP